MCIYTIICITSCDSRVYLVLIHYYSCTFRIYCNIILLLRGRIYMENNRRRDKLYSVIYFIVKIYTSEFTRNNYSRITRAENFN